MSNRSQSLLMAIDVPEPIHVREDCRRLLAVGSAWLVLGTLSGAASLTANYATLAVFGTLSLICAVVTIRGALRSNLDAMYANG
jgi:Flp pilus assembly pilin Flp